MLQAALTGGKTQKSHRVRLDIPHVRPAISRYRLLSRRSRATSIARNVLDSAAARTSSADPERLLRPGTSIDLRSILDSVINSVTRAQRMTESV